MSDISIISKDVGVKPYHMACALTDMGHTVNMYYTSPDRPFWGMWGGLMRRKYKNHTFYADRYKKSSYPFKKVLPIKKYTDSDLAIVSSTAKGLLDPVLLKNTPFIFDVEDSTHINHKILTDMQLNNGLRLERKFIEQAIAVTWGSDGEQDTADEFHVIKIPSMTLYPMVARSTIPMTVYHPMSSRPKVVYAGSIWSGSYRDYLDLFISMVEANNLHLTILMLNSYNQPNWKRMKTFADNYPNVSLLPAIPYEDIKRVLSNYDIGIVGGNQVYDKMRITYGMKPLEYAYAGIHIASLGIPVNNLSDKQPFSYQTTPDSIITDLNTDAIKNFDYDYHLMDRQLHDLFSGISLN